MKEVFLAIPSIILIGTANVIIKWRITYLNQYGISIFSKQIFSFFLDPYFLIGVTATFISIMWYLNIIPSVRLGVIYPVIQAGSIIFTIILSTLFLNESLNLNQYIAIIFIMVGIVILSSSY
tara:strand:- start:41 stop:406 length:366 start_codon:yes stop_codon:yes gene_type:complete